MCGVVVGTGIGCILCFPDSHALKINISFVLGLNPVSAGNILFFSTVLSVDGGA